MKEKKITLLRSKPSTSIGLLSLALLSLLSFTSLASGQNERTGKHVLRLRQRLGHDLADQ